MSKKIVLCFDGTWNRPADAAAPIPVESNVCRFHESISAFTPGGTRQDRWYDQGVGTHWYDKAIGGITGAGLEKNILDGYHYLAQTYEDGDEVFLLGFSRGAYTARSLVGMIRNCGLIKAQFLSPVSIGTAYGIYRTRDDGVDSKTARLFRNSVARPIRIRFVGVWDTVGALGIPGDLLKHANASFHEFHDTNLSDIVEYGFHAVAIDENRRDYDACMWNPEVLAAGQVIEQRWFVGAHRNVGGGTDDRGLSDITLRWMQTKAAAAGLAIDPARMPGDGADAWRSAAEDSYASFLEGVYAKLYPRYFRAMGRTPYGNETVDQSVKVRFAGMSGYRPANEGFARFLV